MSSPACTRLVVHALVGSRSAVVVSDRTLRSLPWAASKSGGGGVSKESFGVPWRTVCSAVVFAMGSGLGIILIMFRRGIASVAGSARNSFFRFSDVARRVIWPKLVRLSHSHSHSRLNCTRTRTRTHDSRTTVSTSIRSHPSIDRMMTGISFFKLLLLSSRRCTIEAAPTTGTLSFFGRGAYSIVECSYNQARKTTPTSGSHKIGNETACLAVCCIRNSDPLPCEE
jgi:hypothetical protein